MNLEKTQATNLYNIIIQVQPCVFGAGMKMAWWLLFYLGEVWLLMLALRASTVEACGICGGKLFHVKIVLEKKLYLKAFLLVWYCWKLMGWVRESLSFGFGEML